MTSTPKFVLVMPGRLGTFAPDADDLDVAYYTLPATPGLLGLDGAPSGTGTGAFARVAGVNCKVLAGHTAPLAEAADQYFVPARVVVTATAVNAAAGDAEITVGTAVGGVDILPATALTGLTALRKSVITVIIDDVPAILGTASLYVTVTKADAGAALTVTVTIEGTLVP